jgi:hypothetical protein
MVFQFCYCFVFVTDMMMMIMQVDGRVVTIERRVKPFSVAHLKELCFFLLRASVSIHRGKKRNFAWTGKKNAPLAQVA